MNISAPNRDLFDNVTNVLPKTEGIKYAGSKLKLLPNILEIVRELPVKRVLDGFSGTTRVSQAFAKDGLEVICSDISVWSEVFGKCYLNGGNPTDYEELIAHLNNCKPMRGWFTENYGKMPKKPWQNDNLERLDGIRTEIQNLKLNEIEEAVALTSLILALDKVDSTIGHFASYLKDWSPRSYKSLKLNTPLFQPYLKEHKVLRGDIFTTAKSEAVDLAYLDPPYGSNNEKMPPSRVRYAAYYHLWKTIILNDEPELFGVVRRRTDTRDKFAASVFEEYRKDKSNGKFLAVGAIEKLLKTVNAPLVLLSYSSGGRATAEDLRDSIKKVGRLVRVHKINHKKNVMAGMRWTDEWVRDSDEKNKEFLLLIEK